MSLQSKGGFLIGIERTHGRQLRRFLSARMRGATDDVPDLIQEIFLRLLRIKDHEAIQNPQAYLFTVASHVLHQYTLKRAMGPVTMAPLELVSELQTHAAQPDPAETAEVEQRFERLNTALQRFSPRAYATLLLHRCDGLTLVEIAARLGVSPTMARKYLLSAIEFCDRHLEDEDIKEAR